MFFEHHAALNTVLIKYMQTNIHVGEGIQYSDENVLAFLLVKPLYGKTMNKTDNILLDHNVPMVILVACLDDGLLECGTVLAKSRLAGRTSFLTLF